MRLQPNMTIKEAKIYLKQRTKELIRIQNNTKRTIIVKWGEVHDEDGNLIHKADYRFRLKVGEIGVFPRYIANKFVKRKATPLGFPEGDSTYEA